MQKRSKPFWQMPWWEWLILLGSLSVIIGFYGIELHNARVYGPGHHAPPSAAASLPRSQQ